VGEADTWLEGDIVKEYDRDASAVKDTMDRVSDTVPLSLSVSDCDPDSWADAVGDALDELERYNADGVSVSDGSPESDTLVVLVIVCVRVTWVCVPSSDRLRDSLHASPVNVTVSDIVLHRDSEPRRDELTVTLRDADDVTSCDGDGVSLPDGRGLEVLYVRTMRLVASSEIVTDFNDFDRVTDTLNDNVSVSAVPLLW
jgi:hypothetical protein